MLILVPLEAALSEIRTVRRSITWPQISDAAVLVLLLIVITSQVSKKVLRHRFTEKVFSFLINQKSRTINE